MNDEMLAQIVSTIVRVASPEQAKMLLSMARKDMSALQGMSDSEIFDRAFAPCQ
ncbi:MAG: hypothetical protein Q9M82_05775 [Mariprofundus sp.]|nr:hypothetical protein [Mariprofundus sp.]